MNTLRPHRLAAVLSALLLVACGSKDDPTGADADGDTSLGVSGTLVVPGAGSMDLVDGRAFDDDGEGGQLRVLLTTFSVSCAEVEDGLGFNTPDGEAFLALYPAEPDDGDIFLASGNQVNLEAGATVSGDVSEDGGAVAGDITLDDGESDASFRIEHCGSLDPFGS